MTAGAIELTGLLGDAFVALVFLVFFAGTFALVRLCEWIVADAGDGTDRGDTVTNAVEDHFEEMRPG